ncbi:MAG: tRNA-dihydrouridine synthase family protein [archaeon]
MEKKFYYMLAPIEGMTDSSFRTLCHGADLTFTELISLEALAKNNESAMTRAKLHDSTPTAIQIIGQKEQSLSKYLSRFSPEKGFKGFNLNLGCPDPRFIKEGLGCAMIKRVTKIKRMVNIIKDQGYETSIKMRLGLNKYEKDKKAYLNLINNVDAEFFVVHARHGKQTYADKADWSVFPECVKTGKNIIANGDIKTKEDIEKMKDCKGVMIGREAIRNPLIFAELKGLKTPPPSKIKEEYEKLLKERNAHPKYQKNIFKHFANVKSETG